MVTTSRSIGLLALFVTLALVTVAPPAAAQGTVDCGDPAVTTFAETYNDNVQQAPSIVSNLFGGKTTELRVGPGATMPTATSGDAYHFTLAADGGLTDCGSGDASSPDIRVRTSNETLVAITTAEDPGAAFQAAYANGDVKVAGIGVTNGVLVGLVELGGWLASLA